VVTFEGDRIVGVGPPGTADGKPRDLGDVALLPGLVNAHTHLEFSHLQKPLGKAGARLADWLRLVIAERQARIMPSQDSILSGLRESVAAGVTTIGEIATADAREYASDLPIDLTLLVEVIGFSRARAESVLLATAERLAAVSQVSLGGGRTTLGLSPHAPYTVSPDLLARLIALASRDGLPVAMHLAESTDELELLAAGTGPLQQLLDERSMWDATAIPQGSRPLAYLQALTKAPRALVIHGNYLDAEEQAFLANYAERMSLIYCPRTHTYFGHAPYPLAELLTAGVRVAVGTDSRASNPDLSLLGEMRCVASKHPGVAPSTVLRLGTLAGAEALGREGEAGSITPGKRAHLIAVPLPGQARSNPDDLLAAMLAADDLPAGVWIAGNQV
jgi:aminodeoxyfutalosine deaminase